MDSGPGFCYLNLENRWPGFDHARNGLALREDGALVLAGAPLVGPTTVTVPADVHLSAVDATAPRLTADGNGLFRASDPASHRDHGYRRTGGLVAGPFAVAQRPTQWHGLQATVDPLPADTHLRFYTLTSERLDGSKGTRPSAPWAASDWAGLRMQAEDSLPSPLDTWRALPLDATEGRILNAAGRFLWLAAAFRGDGNHTPVLHQIRVDFAHEGWLRHLPESYRTAAPEQAVLERMLALFEHSLGRLGRAIDDLPALCSPWSAPDTGLGSWLDWLGGWLGVELDEDWDEARRRRVVASAFALHQRRGTCEGIQERLAQQGFVVRIDEPAQQANLWSLGEDYPLGFGTMLAPAYPDGTVLGSTTTPGQSNLIPPDRYGAPLYTDLAHRFRAWLYASDDTDDQALSRLRQLLDQEKPAHTSYDLYLIEPCMRVGIQARLGIDTVVGGPLPAARLDTAHSLGSESVLASRSEALSGRMPESAATLGHGAKLT